MQCVPYMQFAYSIACVYTCVYQVSTLCLAMFMNSVALAFCPIEYVEVSSLHKTMYKEIVVSFWHGQIISYETFPSQEKVCSQA